MNVAPTKAPPDFSFNAEVETESAYYDLGNALEQKPVIKPVPKAVQMGLLSIPNQDKSLNLGGAIADSTDDDDLDGKGLVELSADTHKLRDTGLAAMLGDTCCCH